MSGPRKQTIARGAAVAGRSRGSNARDNRSTRRGQPAHVDHTPRPSARGGSRVRRRGVSRASKHPVRDSSDKSEDSSTTSHADEHSAGAAVDGAVETSGDDAS